MVQARSGGFILSRTKDLYQITEVRDLLNEYFSANSLVHEREARYIRPDKTLEGILWKKGEERTEFLLREEVLSRFTDQMQSWSSITPSGKDPIVR